MTTDWQLAALPEAPQYWRATPTECLNLPSNSGQPIKSDISYHSLHTRLEPFALGQGRQKDGQVAFRGSGNRIAQKFGRDYVIEEIDLRLMSDRKPGRPAKDKTTLKSQRKK